MEIVVQDMYHAEVPSTILKQMYFAKRQFEFDIAWSLLGDVSKNLIHHSILEKRVRFVTKIAL